MPFTIYAFYSISYPVVLIFFFNLSYVLLALCIRARPSFATAASFSPHFLPPVITYNRHNTGIRIFVQNINIWLLSQGIDLDPSWISHVLIITYSLTRLLHRIPNSHDLIPTTHPPVITYNRHSTGIRIPFKILTLDWRLSASKSLTNFISREPSLDQYHR